MNNNNCYVCHQKKNTGMHKNVVIHLNRHVKLPYNIIIRSYSGLLCNACKSGLKYKNTNSPIQHVNSLIAIKTSITYEYTISCDTTMCKTFHKILKRLMLSIAHCMK